MNFHLIIDMILLSLNIFYTVYHIILCEVASHYSLYSLWNTYIQNVWKNKINFMECHLIACLTESNVSFQQH